MDPWDMTGNPNSPQNQLRAWMQFYDQSGVGGPRTGGEGMNAANYAGARLSFAQQMLQRQQGLQGQGQSQMPNYFNGQQPAYVPATATAPNPYPGVNGSLPPGYTPPVPQYQNFLQELFSKQMPRINTTSVGVRG